MSDLTPFPLKHTTKEIWGSTIATFFSKFVFSATFIIPVLLFSLETAILLSIIWGLSLLGIFSYYLAKEQKVKPHKVIIEHLLIAIVVMVITHYIGDWIAQTFG